MHDCSTCLRRPSVPARGHPAGMHRGTEYAVASSAQPSGGWQYTEGRDHSAYRLLLAVSACRLLLAVEEETVTHDEFIGQVQQQARLSSRGDAERASRVVLETLSSKILATSVRATADLPPVVDINRCRVIVVVGYGYPGIGRAPRTRVPAERTILADSRARASPRILGNYGAYARQPCWLRRQHHDRRTRPPCRRSRSVWPLSP
jgi:hypothetical protein